MKQVLMSCLLLGFAAGCGTIGNITGSSAGSANSASSAGSSGSAGSARSSGSGSSAGWFGGRTQQTVVVDQRTAAAGGRTLIATLTDARIERTRDGAIIRATGISPRQGYYDAVLFSPTDLQPDENGNVVLEFRAKEPQFNTNVSTDWSRTITVGRFISNPKLEAAQQIVVVGRSRQVTIRRR